MREEEEEGGVAREAPAPPLWSGLPPLPADAVREKVRLRSLSVVPDRHKPRRERTSTRRRVGGRVELENYIKMHRFNYPIKFHEICKI